MPLDTDPQRFLRRKTITDMLVRIAADFVVMNVLRPSSALLRARQQSTLDAVRAATALGDTPPRVLSNRVKQAALEMLTQHVDPGGVVSTMAALDLKVAVCPDHLTMAERQMIRDTLFRIMSRFFPPELMQIMRKKLPPLAEAPCAPHQALMDQQALMDEMNAITAQTDHTPVGSPYHRETPLQTIGFMRWNSRWGTDTRIGMDIDPRTGLVRVWGPQPRGAILPRTWHPGR